MTVGAITGKFFSQAPNASNFNELPPRQLMGTIIGLQLTLLLASLDQTIVSTAMPKIIASLNGFERYAWVTTSYMLASTTAVPIFGKLSDLYGRKWILLGGTFAFLVTSALCGLAGNIPFLSHLPFLPLDGMAQLIIFRGLQGIAGGTIMAMCFTVIADIFPPAERGKYQGLFSAVFGLSSVIGPALGGFISDTLTWRWVFYVNVPVGILALGAIWFYFPHIEPAKVKRAIDVGGVITLIGCAVPLLLALTLAVDLGWTAPLILSLLAVSLLMLVAFIYCEKTAQDPIIPLSLFKDPLISIPSISLVLLGIAMFGSIVFIPLFMQGVCGVSATESGSLLTPMMLMMTFGSVTSGQLSSRTGRYKMIALTGLASMLVGMLLLSQMGVTTSKTDIVRNMLIVGSGLGLMMPVYTVVVQNAAPPAMLGAATATTQFFRSVGGTLGTAIFGSLMMIRYLDHLRKSLPPALKSSLTADMINPLEPHAGHLSAATQHFQQVHGQLGTVAHQALAQAGLAWQVKLALVSGIDFIFLIGAVLVAIALVLNLFLKEVPLRKGHVHVVAAE